jgi:hypothetical protein
MERWRDLLRLTLQDFAGQSAGKCVSTVSLGVDS